MLSQRTRAALAGALAALSALIFPAAQGQAVHAQTEPTIDSLTITIWPEFDQRAALVFYSGEVAAGPDLPLTLTFHLPPSASIHAVAYRLPDGRLANAPFTIAGDTLTMTSPDGTFHVEFYDASLVFDGEARTYALAWAGDYAVNRLVWEVQQPAGAGSLSIAPGESTLHTDRFGLPLYRIVAGALLAGEAASIEVRYAKPTPALTVELLQAAEQPAPTPAPIPPGLSSTAFLAIMGLIIAALAGVAGYFYSESRRPAAAPAPEIAHPLEAAPAPPAAETELTAREIEVLRLVAEGLMNDQIGGRLGISPRTVARHRENIMNKLDLHSRTELAKYAIRLGLIELDAEG